LKQACSLVISPFYKKNLRLRGLRFTSGPPHRNGLVLFFRRLLILIDWTHFSLDTHYIGIEQKARVRSHLFSG
jgi:hypothetical protein